MTNTLLQLVKNQEEPEKSRFERLFDSDKVDVVGKPEAAGNNRFEKEKEDQGPFLENLPETRREEFVASKRRSGPRM